jgi:hypothetical protein
MPFVFVSSSPSLSLVAGLIYQGWANDWLVLEEMGILMEESEWEL